MLILVISRGVPSEKDPQWGCFEKDQAEALTNLGHKVVVISVDSRFRTYWRKLGITHKRINGVDYYDYFLVPDVIFRMLFGLKFNFFIRKQLLNKLFERVICEHGMPDILYSHYLPNSYIALNLKEKYHLPLVAIEHWSQLNKDVLSDSVTWLGRETYGKCDAIISVSKSLRQRLIQHFQMDSYVIHNMVGGEFWNLPTLKNRSRRNKNSIRFVSVGSLLYGKGYDMLIEALSLSGLKDFELKIIGEGNYRNKLEYLIEKKGFSNNVFLLGKKDKQGVLSNLLESDVFIHPSRGENFSVAIIEGLSAGLPVIASLCGGASECINESNGLLFPVDDTKSLSDKLIEMSLNYQNYDRQKISDDCRMNYSPKVIASKIVEVFNQVLDHKNKEK